MYSLQKQLSKLIESVMEAQHYTRMYRMQRSLQNNARLFEIMYKKYSYYSISEENLLLNIKLGENT